ncbi:MAG TPA: penicillin acylase family protein [Vicinamibacterales bacterium]|nr:penicillin acylase family protein [Vicinamibacterales bacterium]
MPNADRRLSIRARIALVVTLTLVAVSPASRAAAVPEKGTEILWDTYGIPHIFAPDHPSLFYAYGYAQMEAHAELLVRLYAQARGRGAEFYGDSSLASDRWVRTNGIPQKARQWAAQQSPEFGGLIRAFAAGLNAWADKHPDVLSPLARAVLPLTPEDVYAHGLRIIHYDWLTSEQNVYRKARQEVIETHGSNGWAIGPSKSASGNAMLLSNSHLPWADSDTYFEVQLTAPGVTSYGAVWVGFPVLRQCFTEFVAWTQTTNGPTGADVYRLTLQGDGYVLDGKTRPFEVDRQIVKVRQADGTLRDEPLTIRRSVHGPVFSDRRGVTVALRVVPADRPRMFEQFWRMGLAKNLEEFREAMRMQHLPIFHTMYADRDGHIMYVYNAASPVRTEGNHAYWNGVVPGDRSDLIARDEIVPFDELPQVLDPPTGWVQNANDSPWTSTYPMLLDPAKYAAYIAPPPSHTPRAQRGIRLLSESGKITLADLKTMKLSTRSEIADHFVDDLVAAARALGSAKAKQAGEILARWDRQGETTSDGTLLFLRFVQGAGGGFQNIGGYAVGPDPRQPLTTPRGFADPAKAVALLEREAVRLEDEYDTMHVVWGDVIRLRRGSLDLPGNGMPSTLGGIRTIGTGPFVNGKAQIQSGDTFYAVIEFSKTGPPTGEALLGYGNWSRVGSRHVDDQLALASQKKMRPILRSREAIAKQLESRTTF